MYVPEYRILVKFLHYTLNKLKLTFVLHTTLPHFTCVCVYVCVCMCVCVCVCVEGEGGRLGRLCALVD